MISPKQIATTHAHQSTTNVAQAPYRACKADTYFADGTCPEDDRALELGPEEESYNLDNASRAAYWGTSFLNKVG